MPSLITFHSPKRRRVEEPLSQGRLRPRQLFSSFEENTFTSGCVVQRAAASFGVNSFMGSASRQSEREEVETAMQKWITTRSGGSIYICGSPGCGKTTLVKATLEKIDSWCREEGHLNPQVRWINAMSVAMNKQACDLVLKDLEVCAKRPRKMTIAVIDEIDALSSESKRKSKKSRDVLSRIFSLAARGSRLALIAISNSIGMVDSLFPELRATNRAPRQLIVRPYSPKELTDILESYEKRTMEEIDGCGQLFDRRALMLCARAVAAKSADVRDAIRICRKVLKSAQEKCACATVGENEGKEEKEGGEKAEKEEKEDDEESPRTCSMITFSGGLSGRPRTWSSGLDEDIFPAGTTSSSVPCKWEEPLVSIPMMQRMKTGIMAGFLEEVVDSLPVQEKVLLCASGVLCKSRRTPPSRSEVEAVFVRACKHLLLTSQATGDFGDLLTRLCNSGVLEVSAKGRVSCRRLVSTPAIVKAVESSLHC